MKNAYRLNGICLIVVYDVDDVDVDDDDGEVVLNEN